MKKEWKVYIKGVQNRGEEVKQTLINLGGKIIRNYSYGALDSLFFINHYGEIRYASEFSEMGKIIMDNYKEIKLPEQWKNGDILINTDGSDYKVFWEYDSDSDTSFYAHNVSIHINGTLTTYSGSIWHGEKMVCFIEDYRLATPSEAKRFHELLNKCGKDWDAEKKQLVDWKRKPKKGERYWFIGGHGQIRSYVWNNDFADIDFFNFGNYFKTKEKAEAMAKKIKKLLNTES